MRVGFLFATRLVDAVSDCEVTRPDFRDAFRLNGNSLDIYLDACIADYGIVGGEFNLIREGSLVSLAVYYWSPGKLGSSFMDSLKNCTVDQLENGAVEVEKLAAIL
ncbi:MAG: hypothetical protein ACO1RA_04115 [Planctomycetaceae bacterium]